jgi:flagellar hook-associated protein 3 FlgL
MITRMTTSTMMRQAQRNLQSNMVRLATLQDQATSLKAISRPSDDPTGTADSLKVHAQQRAVAQYTRNADNGDGWLTTIDTALKGATDILNRVRDLTLKGANDGSMSQEAKDAIALELVGLKEDLLKSANTAYLGRNVFSGNTDTGVAFDVATYAFSGAPGATVQRRVGDDSTVRVDADGSAVFGVAANSVFARIDSIVTDLRLGTNNIGTHLGALDGHMKSIVGQRAQAGAQLNQLERAQQGLTSQKGTLEARRASIEDLDLAQVILDLKTQEVTYQSALAVTARVLQPTLMDFLR